MVASGGKLPSFLKALLNRERIDLVLCTSFLMFHGSVTLVRGAELPLRERAFEFIAWYSEGLRMATTWGMFSKRPDPTEAVVVGVLEGDRRVDLSHLDARRRSVFERVVDVRLRKFQNRLTAPEERTAWGTEYLEYFCRQGTPDGPLKRVELVLVKRKVFHGAPERERVMRVKCRQKGRQK